jgi:hypothetical protein
MDPISSALGIIAPVSQSSVECKNSGLICRGRRSQVIAVSKAALMMIESEMRKDSFKNDTLKDLKIAVEALKRDATGYEILLNSILTTRDTRPLEKLCNK